MLIGTVVNNGILYVDTTNQMRESMSREDALVEAGRIRLRPILMTSLTTILAMVPMSIGLGEGTEMMQSMGIVIIGGYVASTFLTLLLLPVFYVLMDNFGRKKDKNITTEKRALKKKKHKKKGAKEDIEIISLDSDDDITEFESLETASDSETEDENK